MSTPLRVDCPTVDDIPPAAQLLDWATPEQHVVLQFLPAAFGGPDAKRALIDRLSSVLPDRRVFDSGGAPCRECVTVLWVLPEGDVRANAEPLRYALRSYRQVAGDLARRLALRRGVAPGRLLEDGWYGPRPGLLGRLLRWPQSGRLGKEWRYIFHGRACGFRDARTGQVVEVRLGFGEEFGVLDPYFFARFVKTTPGLEHLRGLLRHDFHDAARVIDLLAAWEVLTLVEGPFGSGWVCRDRHRPDTTPRASPPAA